MKSIDFNSFDQRKRVNFINSLSGFKSANLIGTVSQKGSTNLAIMSSAVHLGADPALIGLVFRPDSVPRHTLENIREIGICTLNHVNKDIFKSAHQTSARFPKDESEFSGCNLTEEYLSNFKAPFVKESHLKCSLKFIEEKRIEINNTIFVVFEILETHLDEDFIQDDGTISIEQMNSVCVSSLNTYHETEKLEKLPYAKYNNLSQS